jgi:hypothetical protein
MDQQLFTIKETCGILRFGSRKIRQLIKEGRLETRENGAGLRITRRSIEAFVNGGDEWHEQQSQKTSPKSGANMGKVRTGQTAKGTTIATKGKPLPTLIPRGPKLNLEI